MKKQLQGFDASCLENTGHFFKGDICKYHHISTLSKGCVFGELGIINRKPRSATVICLQDTHFAILDAKDYERILMKIEKAKFMKKVRFIGEAISKSISLEKISRFVYIFEKVHYRHGERIYDEEDKPQRVFLIKKGTIELNKKVTIEQKQIIDVRVAHLGSGAFFGEDDVLLERPRKFSAVAFDDCTVYVAKKPQFLRYMRDLPEF